jgi:hypothetical protein
VSSFPNGSMRSDIRPSASKILLRMPAELFSVGVEDVTTIIPFDVAHLFTPGSAIVHLWVSLPRSAESCVPSEGSQSGVHETSVAALGVG